jgi:DnaJ-like protein/uncharacterized protein DUF3592
VPTGLRTGLDPYAVLGVDHAASGDEIAKAFRTRAKELHPDSGAAADTTEEFSELVAAYDLLSNHRTRREYDHAVAVAARPVPARSGAEPAAGPNRDGALVRLSGQRWTRRTAWIALVAGTVVALLGVFASIVTWDLHETDARRHARYDPVSATRVGNGEIMFVTHDGRVVRTREPTQHGEGNGLGPTVAVRYDPNDPQHVIVDANTIGRDITLGIVAIKLLVGGLVFAVLGARRLRRRAATDAR